jgi:hypothetical protein
LILKQIIYVLIFERLPCNSYLCNEVLCKFEALKSSLRSYFNLTSRAIRKAQFAQKRVAYKTLLFETTSPKLPNLLKMISHYLLLAVLTNFSRNVTLNVLSRATVGYLLFFAFEQLGGCLQRRKMRIYDS